MSTMSARATETAGEGATSTETAQIQEQTPEEEIEQEQNETETEVPTDAAGNVITPETAMAIDNADLGATNISGEETEAEEPAAVAEVVETAMQAPEAEETEMNKSTIGAAFDSTYLFDAEDAIVYLKKEAVVKAKPYDSAEDLIALDKYFSIHLTGSNSFKYWEVKVGNEIGYLDKDVITRDLSEIEAVARDEIARHGFSYPVRAQLGETRFDTRYYEDFTMPAGVYDALRLTIGDGEGKNWWCVMYPSLCVGAATETEMRDKLDDGEYEVVTSEQFDFRFKLVEYWEDIRSWFR